MYEILRFYASDIALLAGGMTFKEISKTNISNFKIPLPPLEVQQQIVESIAKFDESKNQYLTQGVTVKEYDQIIKEKSNEIIKSFL